MKIIQLVFLCLLANVSVYSQLSVQGNPPSFVLADLDANIEIKKHPSLDLLKIQEEDDIIDSKGGALRFAYPHFVNYSMENSGTWTELKDGKLWRLKISAKDAISINLVFSDFWMPEGSKFWIYNEQHKSIIGAFTEQNNKGSREALTKFGTDIVIGDYCVLEYFEPKDSEHAGQIEIYQIMHGYRIVAGHPNAGRAYGDSGNCQVNANCSEGSGYNTEKNGVAVLMTNSSIGSAFCSGSLLNNTLPGVEPWFLTADHCIGSMDATTNTDASTWVFRWDYLTPGCSNPSTEPTGWFTTSGAILAANKSDSDFALYYLLESPAGASYLGWTTNNPGSGGAGLHHPSGDVMKISTHNITPISSNYDGFAPANSHWEIDPWSNTTNGWSVTEGGSSGSPLFDQNKRIIGQLHGGGSGNPNCSNPGADDGFYGKFSWSYSDSGGEKRRLQDYIDPTCNGNITMTANVAIGYQLRHSSGVITASNDIFDNQSDGLTRVRYSGSTMVTLSDGFSVDTDAHFTADNSGCVAATNGENIGAFADSETADESAKVIQKEYTEEETIFTIDDPSTIIYTNYEPDSNNQQN